MIKSQSTILICLLLLLSSHPSIAELQRPQPGLKNHHHHQNIVKSSNVLGDKKEEEPLDLWSGSSLSAKELAKIAREKVKKDWHWQQDDDDQEERNKVIDSTKENKGRSGQNGGKESRHTSYYHQSGDDRQEQHLEDHQEDDDDDDNDQHQESSRKNSYLISNRKEKRPTSIQKKQVKKNSKRITSSSSSFQDSDSDDSKTSSLVSNLSKLLSLILYISRSTFSLFKYILKPFQFILFLLSIGFSKSYDLAMEYFLRPLSILLSPIYYALSGFYYILIQLPFSFIKAIVKEIYPLYIFFGIAAILGGGLGLGSATVLWFGNLIFKDPEKDEGEEISNQEISSKVRSRSSQNKPRRKESVLTKSIREKREAEENRTKRRRKGFKELNGKLKNLERMELNDDEEFLEEESSEEGLESDDWIKRREGGSKNQEIQELEEEDDHHEEGYFPTGILKNGKSGGKSNYSNSNNHQDSSSLRLNLNNSNPNPNPNPNHLSSNHVSSPQSSFNHLPIGATSRGGWNHATTTSSLSNSTTPNGSASSSPLQTPIASKNFYSKGLIGNHNNQQSLSDHL
jgi:hypothetical protein